MDARRKFVEHERYVRVARGAAESNSIFDIHVRTGKSMNKFFISFSNIADKNACVLINCKILVTRDTIANAYIG